MSKYRINERVILKNFNNDIGIIASIEEGMAPFCTFYKIANLEDPQSEEELDKLEKICPGCGKQKYITSDSGNCDDCDTDAMEAVYNRQADRQEGNREDEEYKE